MARRRLRRQEGRGFIVDGVGAPAVAEGRGSGTSFVAGSVGDGWEQNSNFRCRSPAGARETAGTRLSEAGKMVRSWSGGGGATTRGEAEQRNRPQSRGFGREAGESRLRSVPAIGAVDWRIPSAGGASRKGEVISEVWWRSGRWIVTGELEILRWSEIPGNGIE